MARTNRESTARSGSEEGGAKAPAWATRIREGLARGAGRAEMLQVAPPQPAAATPEPAAPGEPISLVEVALPPAAPVDVPTPLGRVSPPALADRAELPCRERDLFPAGLDAGVLVKLLVPERSGLSLRLAAVPRPGEIVEIQGAQGAEVFDVVAVRWTVDVTAGEFGAAVELRPRR